MRYISYLFLFSFLCFSCHAINDTINLRFGDLYFANIDRHLLTKYPSNFKTQFNTEEKNISIPIKDGNGYYIINGDALLFPQILHFMKYGNITLNSKNLSDRQQERHMLFREAKHYSFVAMTEALAWEIFSNTENLQELTTEIWKSLPKINTRIAELKNPEGNRRFFLLGDHPRKEQPIIIGNNKYGCTYKRSCKNSRHHRVGNIIYAWSGRISLPYNIVTNKMIGEEPKKLFPKYDPEPLLQHVIDERYLCSRIANGNYAIYDAVSAEKVATRAGFEYSSLNECIDDLYEIFGRTKKHS